MPQPEHAVPDRQDPLGIEYRMLDTAEHGRIDEMKALAQEMMGLIGPTRSREAQLAQDRLEEAIMWAAKHIAMHGL